MAKYKMKYGDGRLSLGDSIKINDRVEIKVNAPNITVYVDGEDILTFRPLDHGEEITKSVIRMYCAHHGIKLEDQELRDAARFAMEKCKMII